MGKLKLFLLIKLNCRFMQGAKKNRGAICIAYKSYALYIPTYIMCVFLLFVCGVALLSAFMFFNSTQSIRELESLRQQLTSERTINKSLVAEIRKSHDGIKKIVESFGKNAHDTSHPSYGNIVNKVQLYDILHSMQKNLIIIDKFMNSKIHLVRQILNLTKIYQDKTITTNIAKLNLASSTPSHSTSSSIQKASKISGIFSSINIPSFVDTILLKNSGLKALLETMSHIPVARPVKSGRFVSGFGKRFHPVHQSLRMHRGADFAARTGAMVLATANGVIEKALYSRTFGNYIVINHGNKIKTLYAHMKKSVVRKGQKVSLGQKIGIQGNTGTSTGEHIHYEVIVGRQHRDPLNFIRAKAMLQDVQY